MAAYAAANGASTDAIAAAVDTPTGLYVFDFSNPGKLEPVAVLQSADRPGNIKLSDPGRAQGLRLALLIGGGSLQIYDLTSPAMPVKGVTFRTPGARAQATRSSTPIASRVTPSSEMSVVSWFSGPAPSWPCESR